MHFLLVKCLNERLKFLESSGHSQFESDLKLFVALRAQTNIKIDGSSCPCNILFSGAFGNILFCY